jgi:hypothetical protein
MLCDRRLRFYRRNARVHPGVLRHTRSARRPVQGEDLDQAHAAALKRACSSRLLFDYLLLTDADMEPLVEDPDFRTRLEAPCYDLVQRSGVSHGNARLLRRDAATCSYGGWRLVTLRWRVASNVWIWPPGEPRPQKRA